MDEEQRRIIEDLAGSFRGEVRCDPISTAAYASDASLYQITPRGVAFPRDHEDVVTLARYAAETDLSLIARGAGTGVAGEALGRGLVVDFSRHMNHIREIGEKSVRVQPGVVHERLNRALREHGRYFPPDPSNSIVTTVGSMLAIDAAGSHSVRVGSTRDHVRTVQTVLAGGATIEAGREPLEMLKTAPASVATDTMSLQPDAAGTEQDDWTVKRTVLSKLAKLLADNAELIRERQSSPLRNCCGYYLRGILTEEEVNLARMLVGSEGTLGLFTEATLHTAPLPAHRGVVLLLFGGIEAAVRAVQAIAEQQPSACDLLDRRLLTLAREADTRFEQLISPAAEAALIVEQTGFSRQQVRDRIRMIVDAVQSLQCGVRVAADGYTEEDVEFLWSLPTRVVPLLTRLKGEARPLPFIEDVAVPPEALADFLVRAQRVFQKHQVTSSLYAHAAAGQIHLRPFLPPPGRQNGQPIEALARDLYREAFAVGGSISGEHGDGLSRTAFIRSQYGPLYRVFQQIKDIFDPHNLLNPGKIVSDDAHLAARNFRPGGDGNGEAPETVELQLQWDAPQLAREAARCNGCGVCKTQTSESRMCPFFRVEPCEETSPRSKANVLRNFLSGTVDSRELTSREMKDLAGLCFNCKQCQLECPSNVNIPQMMIEAKASYVAAHGLDRADWILSRAHSFGALGSTASFAANWALANPAARWLLENLFGIARQRKLPRFARRSFLRSVERRARKQPATNGLQKPVVYFVDHYANYHDPALGQALLAVLEHNGIPVHVPRDQTASGMAMISAGDLDPARDLAETNLRALAEFAREGHPIVCTEPAAALCLKYEYPMILDHPDVETVASQVVEAGEFLRQLHEERRLKTGFEPLDLDAGYHTPCHLKMLNPEPAFTGLLTLIPGLRLHTIETGCSGMAGAFGLTRENFRASVRMGWGLISRMRQDDLAIGTTECSSCKIQMEQGTATPTVHPLKLLALAYGLMPELRACLKPAKKRLVVT